MRSPSQPESFESFPRDSGSDLSIRVFLQELESETLRGGEVDSQHFRVAADMVLDFLRCQAGGATKVAPNQIVANPADIDAAVATFFIFRPLLQGFANGSASNNLRFVVALEHERDRDAGRGGAGPSFHPSPESVLGQDGFGVLWSSRSVYEKILAQAELGLVKTQTGSFDLRRLDHSKDWYPLVPGSGLDQAELPSLPPPPVSSSGIRSIRWDDTGDRTALWLIKHLDPRVIVGSVAAMSLVFVAVLTATLHSGMQRHRGLSHTPPLVRPAQAPGPSTPAVVRSPPPPLLPNGGMHPETGPGVTAARPLHGATNPGSIPSPATVVTRTPSVRTTAKAQAVSTAPSRVEGAEDANLKARHSGVGYTPAELKKLVSKADQLAGNGNYDQAISFYEIVLRNDPKNADARRGLARARENKSQ